MTRLINARHGPCLLQAWQLFHLYLSCLVSGQQLLGLWHPSRRICCPCCYYLPRCCCSGCTTGPCCLAQGPKLVCQGRWQGLQRQHLNAALLLAAKLRSKQGRQPLLPPVQWQQWGNPLPCSIMLA
jgi:hypothetical protein